jgi:hypothetical protein
VHEGKQNAVIIDHAGNLHRHGTAEDAREWSLDGRPKKKGKSEPVMKDCPQCYCCVGLACQVCPQCGHEFEVKSRAPETVEGDLVEFNRDPKKPERKSFVEQVLSAVPPKNGGNAGLLEFCETLFPDSVSENPRTKKIRDTAVLDAFRYFFYANPADRIVTAEMVRLSALTFIRAYAFVLEKQAQSYEDFAAIAKLCGYKPGWAHYKMKNRGQKFAYNL